MIKLIEESTTSSNTTTSMSEYIDVHTHSDNVFRNNAQRLHVIKTNVR